MTNKKSEILEAALELFAEDGYNATSTSKIAKKAGVSEGLIFRHFENKKGLLDALYKEAEIRLQDIFTDFLFQTDPKEVLRQYIMMPAGVPESESNFWKLQFKLKWETEYYNPKKLQPIQDKLTWAFNVLNYPNPEMEAKFLMQASESYSIEMLREGKPPTKDYEQFLFNKYKL